MAQQKVHAVIYKDADSDQWVAVCLEYNVASQQLSCEASDAWVICQCV